MTYTELRNFIRLQISEEVEAQFLDTDLDNYIVLAINRFSNKTKALTYKKTFTVDPDIATISGEYEVFEITCVADLGDTINSEYFVIYDTEGNEYRIWYDVNNTGTAPATPVTGQLIEVDIATSAINTAVATATQQEIDGIVDSNGDRVFNAVVLNEVITVTLVKKGYIENTQGNFNVDNGVSQLSISITTTGLDEGYDIGKKVIKERGVIYQDTDGDCTYMTGVNYIDFIAIDDEDREGNLVFHLDGNNGKLYIPEGLDDGTIIGEYLIKASRDNAEDLINDNDIPEEYHEAIANYSIYLAFKKSREFEIANQYFTAYIIAEKDAEKEVDERRQSSMTDDFDTSITNQHYDSEHRIQNIGMEP